MADIGGIGIGGGGWGGVGGWGGGGFSDHAQNGVGFPGSDHAMNNAGDFAGYGAIGGFGGTDASGWGGGIGYGGVGGPGVGIGASGVGSVGVGRVGPAGGGGMGPGGSGAGGFGGGGAGAGLGANGSVRANAFGGMLPSWAGRQQSWAPQRQYNENMRGLSEAIASLNQWAPDSRLAQRFDDKGPRALANALGDKTFAEGIQGIMQRALMQQINNGGLSNRNMAGMYNALSADNAAKQAATPGTAAYNAMAMANALGLNLTPGQVDASAIPANVLDSRAYKKGYTTSGWDMADAKKFGDRTFSTPKPAMNVAFRVAQNMGSRGGR